MKVAVVSGICVRHDAISAAAVDQALLLADDPAVDDVTFVTGAIDHQIGVPVVVVPDPWRMVTHPSVGTADLVVMHWGIAYDLFDAIAVLPSPTRRVAVHFHNVTPAHLLTGTDRDKSDRSAAQLHSLVDADLELWTYSEHNRRTLLDVGIPPERIHDVPITVAAPVGTGARSSERVELLVVGRLVPAKGVHVAVEAMALLEPDVAARAALTIAGNVRFSDPEYVRDIRQRIEALGLADRVSIVDSPDALELGRLYHRAHVVVSPSFHEGLCVPIVEGYLAGCTAIGSDAGNVPYAVQPPDPIVPAGDATALAAAMSRVVRGVLGGHATDRVPARTFAARFSRAAVQRALAAQVRRAAPVSTR